MEEQGPVIDGDLVIVRGVTSYWGNKDQLAIHSQLQNGKSVWASTSGVAKDSSFSRARKYRRRQVFYTGTGDGM